MAVVEADMATVEVSTHSTLLVMLAALSLVASLEVSLRVFLIVLSILVNASLVDHGTEGLLLMRRSQSLRSPFS